MTFDDALIWAVFFCLLAALIPESRSYITRTTVLAASRLWLWKNQNNLLSTRNNDGEGDDFDSDYDKSDDDSDVQGANGNHEPSRVSARPEHSISRHSASASYSYNPSNNSASANHHNGGSGGAGGPVSSAQLARLRRGARSASLQGPVLARFGSWGLYRKYNLVVDGLVMQFACTRTGDVLKEVGLSEGKVVKGPASDVFVVTDRRSRSVYIRPTAPPATMTATAGVGVTAARVAVSLNAGVSSDKSGREDAKREWMRVLEHNLYAEASDLWIASAKMRAGTLAVS